MKKLSLVIPCYNEEKSLKSIIDNVLKLRDRIELEVVIVDDCSADRSFAIATDLAARYPDTIVVLQHDHNMGKGAAIKTGFMKASGDFIGIQDADMEYNPADYLKLVEPLLQDKADVVFGSRYLTQKTRRILSFWHTLMNKMLTLFSNIFTGLDLSDMETCYKLFKKDVIQKIAPLLKENRFGFEPEVTAYIASGKYRVYECAIEYTPRTREEGKKINWKDGIRALYCILYYGIKNFSLRKKIILAVLIFLFLGFVLNLCI